MSPSKYHKLFLKVLPLHWMSSIFLNWVNFCKPVYKVHIFKWSSGFLICVPMLDEWRMEGGIQPLDGWTFQVSRWQFHECNIVSSCNFFGVLFWVSRPLFDLLKRPYKDPKCTCLLQIVGNAWCADMENTPHFSLPLTCRHGYSCRRSPFYNCWQGTGNHTRSSWRNHQTR